MATEKAGAGKGGPFEFPGSDRNVYAEYLHATFVRRMRLGWFLGGLFFIVIAALSVFYLAYLKDLPPSPSYHPSPRARVSEALAPFVMPFIAVVGPVIAFFGFFPLTVFGCRAFDYAWPRFYSRQCAKSPRPRYRDYGRAYFDSFERHPMQAVVGERSVRVAEPDGGKWSMALRNVRRAYRGGGLVVLETGERLPSAKTAILDVSGMDRRERRRFYRFLDARLPPDGHCKTYYMRTTGPAVGEVVPDGEGRRGGKGPVPPSGPERRRTTRKERPMAEDEKERELLPLGSVVELEGNGKRPFMVYGRMVEDEDGAVWDYLVCAHPEGHMPYGELSGHWFANRENVAKLLFVGYQGGREAEFLEYQRNNVDGSLVWDM